MPRLGGCLAAAAAATVCWDQASGIHGKALQGEQWGFLSTEASFFCPHTRETEWEEEMGSLGKSPRSLTRPLIIRMGSH